MPKIPLYNKGTGTAVDLATGSLSRQASVQAFTAPGRALESFANNAQQIAFNFGQAEKKAQGDAASSDIQSQFLDEANTLILESPTSNTNTAKAEVQSLVNKYNNKLKTNYPNLTNSQIRNISNQIASLGTRASVKHREESFRRGRIIESDNNNKLITKIKDTVKTLAIDNPIRLANIDSVKQLYSASQMNGSNKGFTYPTFESFERAVLSDDVFTKVNNGDIEGAKNLVNTSKVLNEEQKFKLNKTLTLQTQTKQNENYLKTIEANDQFDYTKKDVSEIKNLLEKNEPFSYQLSDGNTLSVDPKAIGTANKMKLMKFFDGKAKETLDKSTNQSTTIINNAPFPDANTFSAILSDTYGDLDTESAQKSISSSANTAASKAERLVEIYKVDPSSVTVEEITEEFNKARYLLNTPIKGNSLVNTVEYGKSSNTLLEKLNKSEIDLRKAALENQTINQGVNEVMVGNFEAVKNNYKASDIEKITSVALKGKSIDEQLSLIQANGLVSPVIKNLLANGVEEGTGTSFNNFIDSISEKVELYKNMKLTGEGLNNHTTATERSFYEAILLNEGLGFSREDAINRVGLSNQTNISESDVAIKYAGIVDATAKIKDGLDGVFGTDVFNITTMQVKAEKYAKFLLKFGTNKDLVIKEAVKDLQNSHILINGHLIPKLQNLPEKFQEKTNLLAKQYVNKNPEIEDAENIAFIPFDGRADKFTVFVEGIPLFGEGSIVSKEDFDNAVIAEQETIITKAQTNISSKKKLTSILQENVENLKETQETVFGFAGD